MIKIYVYTAYGNGFFASMDITSTAKDAEHLPEIYPQVYAQVMGWA